MPNSHVRVSGRKRGRAVRVAVMVHYHLDVYPWISKEMELSVLFHLLPRLETLPLYPLARQLSLSSIVCLINWPLQTSLFHVPENSSKTVSFFLETKVVRIAIQDCDYMHALCIYSLLRYWLHHDDVASSIFVFLRVILALSVSSKWKSWPLQSPPVALLQSVSHHNYQDNTTATTTETKYIINSYPVNNFIWP